MKKTVFIQTLPHYPTPWGDATASWNLATFFKGMGTWTAKAYAQKLKFWSRQNFNIIIDIDKNNCSKLILKHFIASGATGGQKFVKEIDMQTAFDYLDQDSARRTCAFGVVFDPNAGGFNQEYIIDNSKWLTRQPHELVVEDPQRIEQCLQHKYCYLPDQDVIDENTDNIAAIVWFFVYRAVDLPIYYVIPNPDMLGVAFNFNDAENEQIRYAATEPHFGTIGDVIFRPSFSSNVIQMTPNKIVGGNEFDITPFRGGIFEWGFKEQVPKVPLKVFTNLQYTRDEHTNRIHFKFNENQETGYIHIRWNSNALMDLAQSSHSFENLQNKCNLTYDVYKNPRYKYTEE
jgi:hypothetical protein